MDISIIIPTYLRESDLRRLLDSLVSLEKQPLEILVVVGPQDERGWLTVEEFKSQLHQLRGLRATVPSVVQAMNLGLMNAAGDIICFLDDDTTVPVDWLGRIEGAYINNPRLGAYGGRDKIVLKDRPDLGSPAPASLVGRFDWKGKMHGNHHCGLITSPQEVDVIKGANFSFRSAALKPRLIDPILMSRGAEPGWEIDICLRLKAKGYSIIYDNSNWVFHYIGKRTSNDDRTDMMLDIWTKRNFNSFYLSAKFRPFHEILCRLLDQVFRGNRFQPGFVLAVILSPSYGPKIFRCYARAVRSACSGVVCGLKSRKNTSSSKA